MTPSKDFLLWPIVPFGAEDGDGDAANAGGASGATGAGGANPPASQGNSSNNGSPAGSGEEGNSSATDDDDDDDKYTGYSAKELRRIAADNEKKAKDAAADAKKLQDAEDARKRKQNDDVTNLTKDVSDRDKTIAALRATVTKQAIEGAIRDDKRFEWHDVEMVAQQLDPTVVTVDDQGRVEGIKGSLPKIAKAHKFLLAKDNTDQGQGNNNGNQSSGNGNNGGQQNNGSTGSQPGQGGTSNGSGDQPNSKAMVENYPALAGRI